jgi:hypothetical protein
MQLRGLGIVCIGPFVCCRLPLWWESAGSWPILLHDVWAFYHNFRRGNVEVEAVMVEYLHVGWAEVMFNIKDVRQHLSLLLTVYGPNCGETCLPTSD